jgi:hypothetical protein
VLVLCGRNGDLLQTVTQSTSAVGRHLLKPGKHLRPTAPGLSSYEVWRKGVMRISNPLGALDLVSLEAVPDCKCQKTNFEGGTT